MIWAASMMLVWSFQSQHWAFRFLPHFLLSASGRLAASTGTGLRGTADRMDAIGGRLHVGSEPGRGTTVVGEVPVPDRESGGVT